MAVKFYQARPGKGLHVQTFRYVFGTADVSTQYFSGNVSVETSSEMERLAWLQARKKFTAIILRENIKSFA
jgi:hypothetical protein